MLDKWVSRQGTMLIKGGEVYIDGWEIFDENTRRQGASCRETVALACLYMSKQLQERGLALISKPGGDGLTCADMPSDTPADWLCDETRKFMGIDRER